MSAESFAEADFRRDSKVDQKFRYKRCGRPGEKRLGQNGERQMLGLAYQNTVFPRVSQFEGVAETATRQDTLKKRMTVNLSWKRR